MYIVLLCLLPIVHSSCYWNTSDPYYYFGSKTFYDDVRGDITKVPLLKGCDVVRVWFMMRHGARYPNRSNLDAIKAVIQFKDEILTNHANGEGQLCDQDMIHLKNWRWNHFLDHNISGLTTQGYKEVQAFGKRFQEKFSSLINDLDWYSFRTTNQMRTIQTSKAFFDGLQRANKTFYVHKPLADDQIARPYRYCRRREIDVYGTITNRMKQYQKTPEFIEVLQELRNRTGMSQLLPNTLIGFYNLCRYYRVCAPSRRDAWCSLFDDQQLQKLEYYDDVEHYYNNGYGNDVNVKLGGLGLKDLYENFNDSSNNKTITGYFTHAAMIEMICTALGLFNDTKPGTGDTSRSWRTSLNAPFGANFIAVLYRCKTNILKVQFFVNEKEIRLCKSKYCSWHEFQEKFQPFLASNYNNFCNDSEIQTT